MLKDVVILVGGFGTRLSHVLGQNIPKPMAPVYGKPFLTYILDRLIEAGAEHVILATGYKHEVIEKYCGNKYRSLKISYSEENTPLLTGGAILKASKLVKEDDFLVLNGDTLFNIDLPLLCTFHKAHNSPLSIALREVDDTARYGAVKTESNRIVAFCEKDSSIGAGVINGGIYAVNKKWLQGLGLPEEFSFEKDLLQKVVNTETFYGLNFNNYFIDIGVPEDYRQAQKDFVKLVPQDKYLFLDRDGVLNKRIVGDYVRNWEQWEWLPNSLEAIVGLSKHFTHTFIVTNQQGVGKGLFSLLDVERIHQHMVQEIEVAGGSIDKIYVCGDLKDSGSKNRKPAIGMALQACKDYDDVDLSKSVMIGDGVSDMEFGWRAGMRCVFLTNGEAIPPEVNDYTELVYSNLKVYESLLCQ